jgi:hypothetical protein
MDPEISRRLIGLIIWLGAFLLGVSKEKSGHKFGGIAAMGFAVGMCITLA